jgi:transcriptional regulator NrdR family protein
VKCPRCGADSDVLETRTQTATVVRRRRCFNEHRFVTHEVPPGALDKRRLPVIAKALAQRAAAWGRRQVVLRSQESATETAKRVGLTEARVRQIRAGTR